MSDKLGVKLGLECETDKRTQNWQIKLNNARTEFNNMERELDGNKKAFNDAANAGKPVWLAVPIGELVGLFAALIIMGRIKRELEL